MNVGAFSGHVKNGGRPTDVIAKTPIVEKEVHFLGEGVGVGAKVFGIELNSLGSGLHTLVLPHPL